MEAESFAVSLKAFSHYTPFKPFSVELASGDRFTVDHPEALVFRGGLAVYVAPNGQPVMFDHRGVTRLIGAPGTMASAPAEE